MNADKECRRKYQDSQRPHGQPDTGERRDAAEVHGIAHVTVGTDCNELPWSVEDGRRAAAAYDEQADADENTDRARHDQSEAGHGNPGGKRAVPFATERPQADDHPQPEAHERRGEEQGFRRNADRHHFAPPHDTRYSLYAA